MTTRQIPWQRFRKRPVAIDAFRWWGEPVEGFERAVVAAVGEGEPERHELIITTREGVMHADEGDWIIRGVMGEVYPCKDDIFRMTYDLAPSDA